MDGVVTANLSELRLTPVAKLQIGIRAAMKDVEIGVHQAPIAREHSNGLSPRCRLTQTIAACHQCSWTFSRVGCRRDGSTTASPRPQSGC